MKRFSIFILWFLSFAIYGSTEKNSLTIYVFEIIPLIYQDQETKQIKGLWYDSFEELSKKSGIEFHYRFVSIPRLEILLSSAESGCNLTLLKTKTRLKKGIHFIYEHQGKTIFKVYKRTDDPTLWTLNKLQKIKKKMMTNTDAALEILTDKKIPGEVFVNLNSIVQMLLMKRIDYFTASHLAIEKMPEFKEKNSPTFWSLRH